MSWGERSCKFLYEAKSRPCKPEIATCNVNCPLYQWDGKTTPDSRRSATKLCPTMRAALEAVMNEHRKGTPHGR